VAGGAGFAAGCSAAGLATDSVAGLSPCAFTGGCLSSGSLGMFPEFRLTAGSTPPPAQRTIALTGALKLYFLTHAAQLRKDCAAHQKTGFGAGLDPL
jgi:hypothetical protein